MYIVGQSAAGHDSVYETMFINEKLTQDFMADRKIKMAIKHGTSIFYILRDDLFKLIISLIEKCDPEISEEYPPLFILGLIKKCQGCDSFHLDAGVQRCYLFFNENDSLPEHLYEKLNKCANRGNITNPDIVKLTDKLLRKYSLQSSNGSTDKDDNVVVETNLKYVE